MRAQILLFTIVSSFTFVSSADDKAVDTPDFRRLRSYGSAVVEKFLEADNLYTFRCNIKDWPSIIGQDIPVMIKNIEPPAIVTDQKSPNIFFELQVKKFLEAKLAEAKSIKMERIQRGYNFCLVADVIVDGESLARLLIENDLAKLSTGPETDNKVRQNRRPNTSQLTARPSRIFTPQQTQQQPLTDTYVASKNGKVFHKASCSHVKRITPENLVRFNSRQEAMQKGRRPCKTCNP